MWGMNICSNFPGHITMLIYGKNNSEIFFFGNKTPMTLNMVYSIVLDYHHFFFLLNDDPGSTLTIFMTGSNLFPNVSVWMAAYTKAVPEFVDKDCKIIIRQNKIMCVCGLVGKAFNVNCAEFHRF